jgi:glutathione S-transferase
MKLYYAPGTCSLAPQIVALEAGLPLELVRVDLQVKPHRTEHGADYTDLNPNGYVPLLELDDGSLLSEGAVILQYLADRAPDSGLAPPPGSFERYRLQEWLNFVGSELHKAFSPWLFHPEYGEQAQRVAREKISERLLHVDRRVAHSPFLMGDRFSAADAYCFTVIQWSRRFRVELTPDLEAYLHRIQKRAAVREAMHAHRIARTTI